MVPIPCVLSTRRERGVSFQVSGRCKSHVVNVQKLWIVEEVIRQDANQEPPSYGPPCLLILWIGSDTGKLKLELRGFSSVGPRDGSPRRRTAEPCGVIASALTEPTHKLLVILWQSCKL